MEISNYDVIKKQFANEIIKDLKGLEFPPEWRPREVLNFLIRKIEEKSNLC